MAGEGKGPKIVAADSPNSVWVRFWGTRGSIPTPGSATQRYGGNSSCVELRFGNRLFVCDAGTGLREFGVELDRIGETPACTHLFFSHSHWDHIQGFPFFTQAYNPKARIMVYGDHAGPGCMYDLLGGQMQERYFPVSFRDLGATIAKGHLPEPEGSLEMHARAAIAEMGLGRVESAPLRREGLDIDGVNVRLFRSRHPGGCLAYRFSWQGTSVVYCTDNELDVCLADPQGSIRDPSRFRRAPADFVDFVAGADLLIADAQYTDQEYPRRVGWGHSRANTIVDLAIQAEVRRVSLYHHDPLQDDAAVDRKVEEGRARAVRFGAGDALEVSGARERVELKLR